VLATHGLSRGGAVRLAGGAIPPFRHLTDWQAGCDRRHRMVFVMLVWIVVLLTIIMIEGWEIANALGAGCPQAMWCG
jgi:hypothetical protein